MKLKELRTELVLLQNAAEALVTGFAWDKSEQGAEYWCEAYYNLQNMEAAMEQRIVAQEEAEKELADVLEG